MPATSVKSCSCIHSSGWREVKGRRRSALHVYSQPLELLVHWDEITLCPFRDQQYTSVTSGRGTVPRYFQVCVGLFGREVHNLVLFVPRGDLAGCNPTSPGQPVLKSGSPGMPQLPRVSPVLCVLCGCHSLRRFCWRMLVRNVVIWRHNNWDSLNRIVEYNRWSSSEVNLFKIPAASYFCVSVSLCGFFNSFKNASLSI